MNQQQADLSFKDKVSLFLNNNWKIVVVIFVAAVAIMAGILILNYSASQKEVRSSMLSEDIQDAYTAWMSEDEDSRDGEALEALLVEAESDYSRFFAAQRAAYTRALMAVEQEDWEAAYTAFEALAEQWPESYLASVSLFSAGSAREESGDVDGAITVWQLLVDEYSEYSAEAPEALFNIGRIEDSRGNIDAAITAYSAIGSDFPESRWTNIAKSRIIELESR